MNEANVIDLGGGDKAEFTTPPTMTPERIIARLVERIAECDATPYEWSQERWPYEWRKGISDAIRAITTRNGCWDAIKCLELT